MENIENNDIFLHCDECGTDTFIGTTEPDDTFRLICPACNADNGTWGSAKQKLHQDVAEVFKAGFSKTFKGVKGIKFTASEDE